MTTASLKKPLPGAKASGTALDSSVPDRRTGCSWNALKGYDYRWLDVTYEVSATTGTAATAYGRQKQGTAVPDLGDKASIGSTLTREDGQQTRAAVVIVRQGNALITVPYNGSDFGDGKAPSAATVREGALTAAKAVLAPFTTA